MMIRDFSSTFTGNQKIRTRMAMVRAQRRSQLGRVAWLVVGVITIGISMSLGCGWVIRTTQAELLLGREEHRQLTEEHRRLSEERQQGVKNEAVAAAAKLGLYPPAPKQIRPM